MSDVNNDELSAFVTSTLNAIGTGVHASDVAGSFIFDLPEKIEFEVAVTAVRSKEGGGGLKIQVFSAEGKVSSEMHEVSRIKFQIGRSNLNAGGKIDYSKTRQGLA